MSVPVVEQVPIEYKGKEKLFRLSSNFWLYAENGKLFFANQKQVQELASLHIDSEGVPHPIIDFFVSIG